MSENKERQSVQNWTSISREELKNAEIRSLQKRRNQRIAGLCIAVLIIVVMILVLWQLLKDKNGNLKQDQTLLKTEAAHPGLVISHSTTDALDWSYAAGLCNVQTFQKALAEGRTDFDPAALPSKEEIIKAKLDAYGHPYVMDQDRFFIFYFQDHDQPWSGMKHGESTVEKSGCGTLCLSMVLTSLTGDIETYKPNKLVKFLRTEHIAAPNLSVRSIPVTNRCLKTGIRIKKYNGPMDLDLVDETLENGGYIILDQFKYAGDYSATFAAKNHYIVIRGGNQKEGYYIANPLYGYSCKGSTAAFAPQNTTQIPAKYFSAFYYYTILPKE